MTTTSSLRLWSASERNGMGYLKLATGLAYLMTKSYPSSALGENKFLATRLRGPVSARSPGSVVGPLMRPLASGESLQPG